jgi:hypothetical protein
MIHILEKSGDNSTADLFGPSTLGNKHYHTLVAVDWLTRYTWAKSQEKLLRTRDITHFIDDLFRNENLKPQTIISNRGTISNSQGWFKYLRSAQVEIRKTVIYHPDCNGLSEGKIQAIK